jgi:phosphatidylglycerophosphate synthase
VAAGFFFSRGGYWNMLVGALLSVWASILDGCDGEVARLRFQSSAFGCWLDTVCDYLYYLLIFTGITWGLRRSSQNDTYLAWGALLLVGTVLSFTVVTWLRRRVAADRPDKFLALWQDQAESGASNPLVFLARHTEFIIRRCFFPYALLVAALLNITKEVFVLTAVGANLVWSIALYSFCNMSRNRPAQHDMEVRIQPDAGINAS